MNSLKSVITVFLIFTCSFSFSQKKTFSIGVQTRITPIYIITRPTIASALPSTIFEDNEKNFVGPGLTLDYRYRLRSNWELGFGTVVRYDKLYQETSTPSQLVSGDNIKVQRSFFLDNYLDVKYSWKKASTNTSKFVGLGLVMAGIGTGYTKTIFREYNGEIYPTTTKDHYQFPAIFTSFGWRFKNNLNAELKMGYCFSNPQRYFNNSFFFPELKVSYDLVKW